MGGEAADRIQELVRARIFWLKETGQPKWKALHKGEKCELVLNNFPEEPLYTLRCGGEKWDLDDSPTDWVIPRS